MAFTKVPFHTLRATLYGQRVNVNHARRTISRSVLVSSSNDVYTNLAVEDWLYKNKKFDNEEVLFLWRNKPTVVIGRHQNPWLECDLNYIRNNNIHLARRNSGGGAVYHDLGNLNCTFFTTRKNYNRRNNLELICNSLVKRWNLDIQISKREDIILNGEFKISGTAAKLGNPTAYHHCTVLFNVNKDLLNNSLDKDDSNIESNATASVRGTVRNLKEVCEEVDFWPLVEAITQEYFGNENQQYICIEPNETLYPGIETIKSGLRDWNWVYGHTPRFVICKQFETTPRFYDQQETHREFHRGLSTAVQTERAPVTLTLQVYRAKIEEFSITPENFLPNKLFNIFQQTLVNKLFKVDAITSEMDNKIKQKLIT
uniref:BPL/LPL catalytic domain-containing protein n=1 Tax=Strigamia maritima TaxID=126957 RepID=T1JD24_STRMM